ncbi:Cytochrome P450 [Glarea lozoyensis ATCC 20868]|uniref:Cytochrome P450 n=1 Tax=Glarea lozoyensis (strain ATCC 20868 / MF5171) TaxID=1116229 RepID=S3CT07_GLAL2|nr:Cytochrome P450 [Glarea lozoyensis ATCC 20868]EPE28199.1 Cytochrome P450 [Glarea lozoyensis ATCC 20868]
MDLYQLLSLLSWKVVAAMLAIYCASLACYRLFLHPLAKFPGPKLAAITRCYEGYYDLILEGQYTFKIAEMHKSYGPIIRISPYELHILDHAFYEKLYGQHDGRDKYQWACNGFVAPGATIWFVPRVILTSLDELHQARRSPLNHFFSKTKVAARQDVVIRNVEKLCSMLMRRVGSTINLGAAVGALVQDVQCDFILNKPYGSLDKDDFNVAIANMCQSVGNLWRFSKHFPRLGLALKSIPVEMVSKVANEDAKVFFKFLKEIDIDTERLLNTASSSGAEKDSPRTVVDELVDSELLPTDKSLPRVLNEVQTIVGAGLETVSGVLRLVLYHVFSNPEILQRLRAELLTVKGVSSSNDIMDLKKLEKLPYLTSIIMEALRMSPAIGSRMARIVSEDLPYEGWSIPAATPVGMTTILMHFDEKLYPEPYSFIPDRWMDIEKRKKFSKIYAPFSRGSRMCAGMYLAWADLYFTLAALALRFDFEFEGIEASDFRMVRDEFVIGVKAKSVLNCRVTMCEL